MDSNLSGDDLLALAKQHLGLPSLSSQFSATVPQTYLDELKKHLMLYPHDYNYRLKLEPGYGLGILTCLEEGCNAASIPLIKRVKVADGGRREGLGSLSAYRHHIADHPTHARNRQARVTAQIANGNSVEGLPSASTFTLKQEPSLFNLLDSYSTSPQTPANNKTGAGLSRLQPLKRVSSLARIKPEPTESSIPRKRHADASFSSRTNSEAGFTPYDPLNGSSKKLKTEATLKTPLALVNNNTGSSENVLSHNSAAPTLPVNEVRKKLESTQIQISTVQDAINRLNRKRRKSKTDITRLYKLQRELESLSQLKEQYNAHIPSISPVKKAASKSFLQAVKAESSLINNKFPSLLYNPVADRKPIVAPPSPVASGSNIRSHANDAWVPGDTDEDEDEELDRDLMAVMQRFNDVIPAMAPLRSDHHDDNGDFHGRGRDLFIGPQAKADDIDKFLLEAGNAEQFDGNASVDKALEKLGLDSQYDLMPGMEIALMPHQTIGVAWMMEKELSSLKGGCLGDDMGLGKTVQMIAIIVKNQSKDPLCKTNLIIAPTALLDQWKLEIEMKTNCGLQCLIYHGSSKPKRKQDILKYDVVLTTYSTMSLEWPDFEAEQKKKEKARRKKPALDFIATDSDDDDDANKPRKRRKESGLLFQIDFYRVILDEAQSIRNRRTRTSRAVTDLRAIYRWCLTGTPIINSLVDVYGYLRFIKLRPWYDFSEFQGHIGALEKKNPALAVSRLQAVITTFLLRRMKDSLLDGKRLIELPDKDVSLVKLEFSEEERDIYKMVEARTQANFNRYLKAGTVLKNYSQVLVLLLRLRQICSHPSLIQEGGVAFVGPDEDHEYSKPEVATELSRARKLVSPDFVTKMQEKLKNSALKRIQAEKESSDAVADDEECPICFDALTAATVTPCGHIFCHECLIDVLNTPLGDGHNEPVGFKASERPCPVCRSAISANKLFERLAFEPSDADLFPEEKAVQCRDADADVAEVKEFSVKRRKGKGKAKAKKTKRAARRIVVDSDDVRSEIESESDEDDDEMSDFIVQSEEDEEEKNARRLLKKRLGKRKAVILDSDDEIEDAEDAEVIFGVSKKSQVSKEAVKLMPRFLPSTKMKYMMEQLNKLVTEHPDEKTLIVSQWTGCLFLVSDYLSETGVPHVKYQGDMNRTKRDQAVRVFMSKDKARVMLMSLKCGGVGLNLTRANNVISLDLGWSQAIEAQAFDRVHRLGQTRPVVVQRLVIADTVEDRVLTMQERKQTLADGSLGEGSGKKIGRLSVKELANLFGLDHRGRVLAKD